MDNTRGKRMNGTITRTILLLSKANGDLTLAEISCILGVQYEEAQDALWTLVDKHIIVRKQGRNGFGYCLASRA